jgi:hypothetical protein
MKRGLVVLDEEEIPRTALERRIEALQRHLRDQKAAAALVYGDVYRSGDITYLSNISLYWNEAVLAIPAQGEPALLTKLSRRVHTWMRATSNLSDLRSGPDLALLAARWLEDLGTIGPVGLVEKRLWPSRLLAGLKETLGGRELVDLGGVLRAAREQPDEGELSLLRTGAGLAAKAVGAGIEGARSIDESAGRAELVARRGGVEDVAVYTDALGDGAVVLEVVAEYRGYWTCAARIRAQHDLGWVPAFEAAYKDVCQALREGTGRGELSVLAKAPLSSLRRPWALDVLHHVDIETGGGYLMPVARDLPLRSGAVAALRLRVELPGGIASASDTFLIGANGAERLTSSLPEHAVVAGS